EQLDHPEWRGRPVIVGGDPARRGVVSAASYEARRFGVRSAMPSARAAALCPDAVWARPRGERYRDVSRAVREIFRSVTPHVQPTSIDEAYLDATPGAHSGEHPLSIASRIRDEVDRLGVSCSIGIATNKTVAKIASDRDKPHGITVVPPGEEASFLSPLPVRLMPGIGSVTAGR
ncbi:MAG: Y-family DNA polymerase, partial [Anaerosomatales bacterium]